MTDINTTPQALDRDTVLLIVGAAFAGASFAALAQVPGVRDACGRALNALDIKEAGRRALGVFVDGVVASVSQRAGLGTATSI